MIVVDTHTWYWWTADDPRLSSTAKGRLNRERDVVVPAICTWEIAMLAARGRIDLEVEPGEFMSRALDWEGVRLAPIEPDIAAQAAHLWSSYGLDPADQLIAATALVLKVPLVTRDNRLAAIRGLETLW